MARFVSMLNASVPLSAHGVYWTQQKPHSCRMHAEYLKLRGQNTGMRSKTIGQGCEIAYSDIPPVSWWNITVTCIWKCS